MCGIAGEFYNNVQRIGREHLVRSIAYRGPDMQGEAHFTCSNGILELYHSRLSIIDLSDTGKQPMSNSRYVLVFNGEIYNYKKLRNSYLSDIKFEGNSDTEVLLHLWSILGMNCLRLLDGMFAFFIWDKWMEQGFLARDNAGIKPLFYNSTISSFSFSSDISAYKDCPIDRNNLQYFVRDGHFSGDTTAYSQVNKVQPGEVITFSGKDGSILKNKWYHREMQPFDIPLHFEERKQLLKEKLDSAVKSQTVADVKMGCFLSGGYDSTAVVASLVNQGYGNVIEAYTLGFDELDFDESDRASRIANHLGVKHNVTKVGISDLRSTVLNHFENLSYPDGDSSIIPTSFLCEQVSRDVKVILSADGGDELFAGYSRLQDYLSFIDKIKYMKPLLGPILRVNAKLHNRRINKLYDVINCLKGDPTDFVMAYTAHFTDYELSCMFNYFGHRKINNFNGNLTLKKLLESEFNEYLINDVLRKVDLATMHNNIEGRVPLLNKDLVNYAFLLPDEDKISQGKGKWILKDLVHDQVPSDIIDAPKRGFAIPINSWLQEDLVELSLDILTTNEKAIYEVFNKDYIDELKIHIKCKYFDNRDGRLWNILNAIKFIT